VGGVGLSPALRNWLLAGQYGESGHRPP
jgi:hypothetical protein